MVKIIQGQICRKFLNKDKVSKKTVRVNSNKKYNNKNLMLVYMQYEKETFLQNSKKSQQ